MEKFYGISALGTVTARGYDTQEEALAAIARKEKKHFARIKNTGQLPEMWTAKRKGMGMRAEKVGRGNNA